MREEESRLRLALFDLDRTLIDGYAYARLLPLLWRQGVRRAGLVRLLSRLISSRLTPSTPLGSWWPAAFASYLGGLRPADLGAATAAAADLVRSDLRREMAVELAARRAEGDALWLVSATVEPLAAPVAAALGFDRCLATRLDLADERFSGRLEGLVCRGQEKRRRVEAEAQVLGEAIDWSGSCYFADGFEDLPLLEAVGRPVAMRPDRPLYEVATARGYAVWGAPRHHRAGG